MSIKHGLLALLERGPMYGYQLRVEFEAATGTTWPLNVGQVYTTLARLDRDGLVEPAGDADEAGRVVYRITSAGRGELTDWFDAPIEHDARPRDELVIKLAMAVSTPGVDAVAVIDGQRAAAIRAIQAATRRKIRQPATDIAAELAGEAALFAAEAEVRWLDHCEAVIRARPPDPPPAANGSTGSSGSGHPASPANPAAPADASTSTRRVTR